MLGYFTWKRFQDKILLTNDTGAYSFLSESEFHALTHGQISLETETGQSLKDLGFWSNESQEAYIRQMEPSLRNAHSYLFEGTSLFILAITNECNNICVYCQANGLARANHMSVTTANQALRRIAECPTKNITIEFQGGEPLSNFPVIQYVVEKAPGLLPNKNVTFTVVSNLLLLTDEMASFFKTHQVSVSTSLDGPKGLHDKNRPRAGGGGSYDGVQHGLHILREHEITPGAIETTTRYSLDYPHEIVDTYQELGFHQIFLRPLTQLGAAARNWDTIGYTSNEFCQFYRTALAYIIQKNIEGYPIMEYHASLFLSKLLRGKAVNYMELQSPCGATLGQVAITSSGDVYTCDEGRMMAEMGDKSFLLGNIFDSSYNDWIESSCCKSVSAASFLEALPSCCDCVYKPYCGVCPVVNHAINGNVTHISKDRCRIYAGILDTLFEYLKEMNPQVMCVFSDWSDQL